MNCTLSSESAYAELECPQRLLILFHVWTPVTLLYRNSICLVKMAILVRREVMILLSLTMSNERYEVLQHFGASYILGRKIHVSLPQKIVIATNNTNCQICTHFPEHFHKESEIQEWEISDLVLNKNIAHIYKSATSKRFQPKLFKR